MKDRNVLIKLFLLKMGRRIVDDILKYLKISKKSRLFKHLLFIGED